MRDDIVIKWGVKSIVWYIFILVIAFCVALHYYFKILNDPNIQRIFFG